MKIFVGLTAALLGAFEGPFILAESQEPSIHLWHSFDGINFHFRSSFEPAKAETWFRLSILKDGYNGVPVELEAAYKDAVQRNGLYSIRVSSDPFNPDGPYLLASVPICELFKYGFREEIILHFSSDNSRVVGLEFTATPTPMTRTCDEEKAVTPALFQTKMKEAERVMAQTIPLIAQGPRPSYLSNVKLASGVAGDADPNTPQQQSFLRKYWYVVVPLLIIFLFGGSQPPEGEGAAAAPAK